MTEKLFPITKWRMGDILNQIPKVPFGLMELHDSQIRINHAGRSADELAESGGLCPEEIAAILTDVRSIEIETGSLERSLQIIREKVDEYEVNRSRPSTGALVHISVWPKMAPIAELIEYSKTENGWKRIVLAYDKIYCNFYDKDEEELKWLDEVRTLITSSIPNECKSGVHLVAEQASFMGEDIYLVDGEVHTTLHCKHRTCGHYKIVWRKAVESRILYCAECKRDVSMDTVGFGDENDEKAAD